MTNTQKNDITWIFTYYGQKDLLIRQLQAFTTLPVEYQRHVKLIFVNDGADDGKAFEKCVRTYQQYIDVVGIKVKKDVGFNSHVCRNIGVHQTRTEWVALWDMDCEAKHALIKHMLDKPLDPQHLYVFPVVFEHQDSSTDYDLYDPKKLIKYRCHPNAWLMTRECFWSTGGYDAEFQGMRHGDKEFFLALGRDGQHTWDGEPKTWEHFTISEEKEHRLFITGIDRTPEYVAQTADTANLLPPIRKAVSNRNADPFRKYKKIIRNVDWDYV